MNYNIVIVFFVISSALFGMAQALAENDHTITEQPELMKIGTNVETLPDQLIEKLHVSILHELLDAPCKVGYSDVIKKTTGKHYCVKDSSVLELHKRGWLDKQDAEKHQRSIEIIQVKNLIVHEEYFKSVGGMVETLKAEAVSENHSEPPQIFWYFTFSSNSTSYSGTVMEWEGLGYYDMVFQVTD